MEWLESKVRKLLSHHPYVRFLEDQYLNLQMLAKEIGHQPGHFYSTIPNENDVDRGIRFANNTVSINAIDLRLDHQIDMLRSLELFLDDYPFNSDGMNKTNLRYSGTEAYYRNGDLLFLYLIMLRHKPRNVIEVGSGHSSAAMLDIDALFFENNINFTFIEPYPEYRLDSILNREDRERHRLIQMPVQDVPVKLFGSLREDDILFIDSSHISKIGSDLNYLLYEILPALNPGVLIHFHDVFYPFELPEAWVRERKWYWNENYLVRAFLMYNSAFDVHLFNSYLFKAHRTWLQQHMPIALVDEMNTGSLWLRKKY